MVVPEAIYTIGYQGTKADDFWRKLTEAGITMLVDTRATAWSPRPQFQKVALNKGAHSAGIGYLHLPRLGISSQQRKRARKLGQETEFLQGYARVLYSEDWGEPYGLIHALRDIQRPALLCCEADPKDCHRGILARWLGEQMGLEVRHL